MRKNRSKWGWPIPLIGGALGCESQEQGASEEAVRAGEAGAGAGEGRKGRAQQSLQHILEGEEGAITVTG